MMLTRIISLAALAAVAGTLLMPSAAEAGSRWRLRFLQPDYYFYNPRAHDFYADDYGDEEYYEDDERPLAYYDPDDDYYEPRYRDDGPAQIAPKKKKTVKAVPVPVTRPVVKKSVAATEKKAVVTTEKKALASVETKAAPATTGMSCDKAEKIVSGYGFTSVKPTTCTGQVFAFNATRSGKAYVIKLSSASGELTEVKKVQ